MPNARLTLARAVAALLAGAAFGLAGCGGDAPPPVAKLSAAEVKAQLAQPPAGQSAVLREIDEEAGQLLEPGPKGPVKLLQARVDALKGTPIVVNLWGDWCVPCKKEMPIFQRVALAQRGKVAFLGMAVNSRPAKAEAFLRDEVFVPYPSILDEDGEVNVGTGVDNLPKTFFYDRAGKRFIHIGPYETEADLLADIKRYAS